VNEGKKETGLVITFEELQKVDMRVGKVVEIEDFPRAKNPSYRVRLDFGEEIGIKSSSLQAKKDYTVEEMPGRYVVCVVNLPPRNIAGFMSEVLVLGVPGQNGSLVILQPGRVPVPLGARVF